MDERKPFFQMMCQFSSLNLWYGKKVNDSERWRMNECRDEQRRAASLAEKRGERRRPVSSESRQLARCLHHRPFELFLLCLALAEELVLLPVHFLVCLATVTCQPAAATIAAEQVSATVERGAEAAGQPAFECSMEQRRSQHPAGRLGRHFVGSDCSCDLGGKGQLRVQCAGLTPLREVLLHRIRHVFLVVAWVALKLFPDWRRAGFDECSGGS